MNAVDVRNKANVYPGHISYPIPPTLSEMINHLTEHYSEVESTLSPETSAVMLTLEARAAVRTIVYQADLLKWSVSLVKATSALEEERLLNQPVYYRWLVLNNDELKLLKDLIQLFPNDTINSFIKRGQCKGSYLVDYLIEVRKHHART